MLRIQAEALTYDDVSLVPAHSTVLPKDVSLETRLTGPLASTSFATVVIPASTRHAGAGIDETTDTQVRLVQSAVGAASSASTASRVFCIRVATVIGPTPPGTGVIQLARWAAAA